jgi:hypothetical protein
MMSVISAGFWLGRPIVAAPRGDRDDLFSANLECPLRRDLSVIKTKRHVNQIPMFVATQVSIPTLNVTRITKEPG